MTDITKYLALQTALVNEKAKLEARLGEIFKALGRDDAVPAPAPSAPSSPATTTTPGKRTFSADTKVKMAAAQKARWAAKKGKAVLVPAPAAAPTPKQAKRTLSEATKAKMRAAHQARWAAKKGTVAVKAAVEAAPKAEPKQKRKISPEAKARMIAGAKKRWAKVNAAKAKAKK